MSFLENVTPINNKQGLQHFGLSHSNFVTVANSLTSKEAKFVKKLKLVSKLVNIFDEMNDSTISYM